MNTPICDFVKNYIASSAERMHMPGHKGLPLLGFEPFDITEIKGADSLYEADGIIAQSEKNATDIFGTKSTFYSAEGSSLCIRAMLFLAVRHAKQNGKNPLILAGRNAHKTFITASALIDFETEWLPTVEDTGYLTAETDLGEAERMIAEKQPAAVYITSPDYLGHVADIKSLSLICRKHGVLLLVDNAHGAYLKFLPESLHPIDLGADICCDSAHKTLPVLTGGAYLHISKNAPDFFTSEAKNALSVFGSTSPSYLILQSLDAANAYLSDGYREKLAEFVGVSEIMKNRISSLGFELYGDEPLKITVKPKSYGYSGNDLADEMRGRGIECEFSDPDYTVFMLSPERGAEGLGKLASALSSIKKKTAINSRPPVAALPERVMSPREAMLMPCEKIPSSLSEGRVLAALNVGCPPAVPIAVCGEKISKSVAEMFEYYGIDNCDVIK